MAVSDYSIEKIQEFENRKSRTNETSNEYRPEGFGVIYTLDGERDVFIYFDRWNGTNLVELCELANSLSNTSTLRQCAGDFAKLYPELSGKTVLHVW